MRKEIKTNLFLKRKNISSIFVPLLFFLTFILVLFNKTDYYLISKLKSSGIDIITPISKAISYPFALTSKTIKQIDSFKFLKSENIILKEEILRLKKWQTLAIKYNRENKAYKKLLNSTSNNIEIVKTASVISASPNIFQKTIIINAGLNNQVKEHYVVINDRGLVGKAIVVNNKNSKILLINDQNSSIPVKSMQGNFYAILHGTPNGRYLVSSFIKDNYMPQLGDILVTSGNANIYNKDILVGKVVKISENEILVLPFVDFKNFEFVQIIKNN